MMTGREAQMLKRSISYVCLAVVLLVVLAACEGAYTTRGGRESSRMGAQGGWVEKRINSANGSATQSIEVDVSGLRLNTEVSLEVEEGTFTIELLDADGNVTLSLQATPGNPASGQGYMETRFDEAEYRVTADGAKGVHYRLDFTFGSP
jgi:hypothetical protein